MPHGVIDWLLDGAILLFAIGELVHLARAYARKRRGHARH